MNELKIFKNTEFGQVRTIEEIGKILFCGSDVAKALGYDQPHKAIERHCKKDGGMIHTVIDSLGREQQAKFITEGDLYRLIANSKLPSAEKFESWVFDEVLPTIRKTGTYKIPLSKKEEMKLYLEALEEQDAKIEAVNKDLQEFKTEMPLLALDCQKITKAKNYKIVPLLGGKESAAYNDKSLRGKVYRDLETQINREFGVETYKAIKRNQVDFAISIINKYELPTCLKNEVLSYNSQFNFM